MIAFVFRVFNRDCTVCTCNRPLEVLESEVVRSIAAVVSARVIGERCGRFGVGPRSN